MYRTGKQIREVLEKGPDYAKELFADFLKDVETLTDRIHDLYHNGEQGILFALMGVEVTIDVKLLNSTAFHAEVGGKLSDDESPVEIRKS